MKDERFLINDITSKDILDFYVYIEEFLTNYALALWYRNLSHSGIYLVKGRGFESLRVGV